jgi:hypothetical protein
MLTHKIVRYKSKPSTTNLSRKEKIFARTLNSCSWEMGDHVKVGKRLGMIVDIYKEYEHAEWSEMMCKIVEIYFYDTNETKAFHPSELRKAEDVLH